MSTTAAPIEDSSLFSLESTTCLHCGEKNGSNDFGSFCCRGCQYVYSLIHDSGLKNYYDFKGESKTRPLIHYFLRKPDLAWLTDELIKSGHLMVDVEGIHCSACVWLLQELSKKFGTAHVHVNSTLGQMEIRFDPTDFDLRGFFKTVCEFGYPLKPASKVAEKSVNGLLIRLGVCMAIAMNTMFLSFSIYLGLNQSDPELFDVFTRLNFYLSILSVAVGGSYFFGRAILSLRRGILHLDVPIAIGILATFVGSTMAYFQKDVSYFFFDTLNIFTSLMLLGRYLQTKLLEKNKNWLLKEMPLRELKVSLATGDEISFPAVTRGLEMILNPGAICPVDSRLKSAQTIEISLCWINGESESRKINQGETITAGALLVAGQNVRVVSESDYDHSLLTRLEPQEKTPKQIAVLWEWVTKWYVICVLSLSTFGFVLWHFFLNPEKALAVFVSILVVTCPCGIGIAIPLARSIANRGMVSLGVFDRQGDLLDKLLKVNKVFFDKTGTLTLSELKLKNPALLLELNEIEKNVLFSMTSTSRHPASRTLSKEIKILHAQIVDVSCREIPGTGLYSQFDGRDYFFGKPDGCVTDSYEAIFKVNDVTRAIFEMEEQVLDEAKKSIASINCQGKSAYILSGDKKERVEMLSRQLGFLKDHSFGNLTPDDKAKFILNLGGNNDGLFLGDGLNDSIAFKNSFLSGAALSDQAYIVGSSDFYYVSGSLSWIDKLFKLSSGFQKLLRFDAAFALVYNLSVVLLALAGLVSPLVCAVLMPVSSLFIVGVNSIYMRKII